MQEKEEVTEITDSFVDLKVEEYKEADPPPNWPSHLPYLTSNIWDEQALEKQEKFTHYLYDVVDPRRSETDELYAVSLCDFEVDCFLGEFVGRIEKNSASIVKEKRTTFPYLTVGEDEFILHAVEAGNPLRFIRVCDSEKQPNVQLQRIWIDGQPKYFLEAIQDIKCGDEVVRTECPDQGEDYSSHDSLGSQTEYLLIQQNLWDHLNEREIEILKKRRDLSELALIQRIEDPSHPCLGQLGLFAAKSLKKGSYLGEYTGRVVLLSDEVVKSKYLVDFSNPFEEGCDQIWVDAAKEGNELRFINDCRGMPKKPNVNMKRVWLAGWLRVFIQLTEDVEEGEEFLTDYGEGYWNNLQE